MQEDRLEVGLDDLDGCERRTRALGRVDDPRQQAAPAPAEVDEMAAAIQKGKGVATGDAR